MQFCSTSVASQSYTFLSLFINNYIPGMKHIFFIVTIVLSSIITLAQEPADALRYSWYIPQGTARQQAIGGAMGSLGGEISSSFVNPAGLGLYRTGDFVITPAYQFMNNKSTYLGRTEKDKKRQHKTTSPLWGACLRVSELQLKNQCDHLDPKVAESCRINRVEQCAEH